MQPYPLLSQKPEEGQALMSLQCERSTEEARYRQKERQFGPRFSLALRMSPSKMAWQDIQGWGERGAKAKKPNPHLSCVFLGTQRVKVWLKQHREESGRQVAAAL